MNQDNNTEKKSQGLGDDIAKITKAMKIDVAAANVAKAMGKKDCGCKKRQEKLNKMFPYNNTDQNQNESGSNS